ncbi:hypothetical protein PF010_g9651 [Phytophthora fragariae]|uniref:Secreted protein n=1 Tax=Phytophthora fragariae TaxID=53985 RepID=A0A6G0LAY3_9STRA|nr:hypothetical protein PF010_g9651 [Phytophthora fragariae]KAE9255539.1 hypothetical protein PF004_g530 [Phytophthora fragariae]
MSILLFWVIHTCLSFEASTASLHRQSFFGWTPPSPVLFAGARCVCTSPSPSSNIQYYSLSTAGGSRATDPVQCPPSGKAEASARRCNVPTIAATARDTRCASA